VDKRVFRGRPNQAGRRASVRRLLCAKRDGKDSSDRRPALTLAATVRLAPASLGLCQAVCARDHRRARDVREDHPEGAAPQERRRRSSGRADLIPGKPRRRKATASLPHHPHAKQPQRRRGARQPRSLGGTRRYLPARSRAPHTNSPPTRAQGRVRGGADGFRLPTASVHPTHKPPHTGGPTRLGSQMHTKRG